MSQNEYDDYDDGPCCEICGSGMLSEQCWCCHGEGGFHDCGEDCCPHLHPEADLNETCEECGGAGFYWICVSLPHTDEQMAAWRAKQGAS